jgi:hypothetical protein
VIEPELPFPGATGRGVKIAIVDSGVNANHPHIVAPIQPVFLDSSEPEQSIDDQAGHGTAVTAAIQEKAPGAEYFVIRLFGQSLRSSSERLMEAICWSIENRMNVVNLSLGTTNFAARSQFEELAAQARASGVLLVSARSANIEPTLPGALPNVIGVDADWELPREHYRIREMDGAPRFIASGYPRPLPGMHPRRNLHGVSFAVANMAGFIARACEAAGSSSYEQVVVALKREARA